MIPSCWIAELFKYHRGHLRRATNVGFEEFLHKKGQTIAKMQHPFRDASTCCKAKKKKQKYPKKCIYLSTKRTTRSSWSARASIAAFSSLTFCPPPMEWPTSPPFQASPIPNTCNGTRGKLTWTLLCKTITISHDEGSSQNPDGSTCSEIKQKAACDRKKKDESAWIDGWKLSFKRYQELNHPPKMIPPTISALSSCCNQPSQSS